MFLLQPLQITTFNGLCVFSYRSVLSFSFVGQLFEVGLTWAKIKVFVELLFWRWDGGLHFLVHSVVYRIQLFAIEGSWSHFLAVGREPFPYSRGCLHSLTHSPFSSEPTMVKFLSVLDSPLLLLSSY